MRMNLLIAYSLVFVAACATTEPKLQQFVGPNGKSAYSIKCGELDGCYKTAGQVCPRSYNVIDRVTANVGVPIQGMGTVVVPEHSLVFECK